MGHAEEEDKRKEKDDGDGKVRNKEGEDNRIGMILVKEEGRKTGASVIRAEGRGKCLKAALGK